MNSYEKKKTYFLEFIKDNLTTSLVESQTVVLTLLPINVKIYWLKH